MSSDSSSSPGLPGRSRPVLSDLSKETTEEDLWNLDEEGAGTALPPARAGADEAESPAGEPEVGEIRKKAAPISARPIRSPDRPIVIDSAADRLAPRAKPQKPEPQRARPTDTFDDLDDGATAGLEEAAQPQNRGPEIAEPAVKTSPEPETPAEDEPVTYVDLSGEEEIPAPVSNGERKSLRSTLRIPRRELIGLSIFAFVLLGAMVWGVSSFFRLVPFKKETHIMPKFPVAGSFATLEKQENFWREPILEGPDRDRAQRDTYILPVLELTLSPKSSSGVLRVIFYDEKGHSVGDAVTRSFSGGKFESSGAPLGAFPATAGFEQLGAFNSYASGMAELWTATVMEGPSPDAAADQFHKLADIPIYGLRR